MGLKVINSTSGNWTDRRACTPTLRIMSASNFFKFIILKYTVVIIYFFLSALNSTDSFTINLYPSRTLMDQAFKDLTSFLNWTRMGIIYEDYGFGKCHSTWVFVFFLYHVYRRIGRRNLVNTLPPGTAMLPVEWRIWSSRFFLLSEQGIENNSIIHWI